MSSEDATFQELIEWVRRGDGEAAVCLVRRYESAIRRAARFRLRSARLNAVLDSLDICQSVLASFFVRAAAGEYEITEPEQLLRLLVQMARNKVVDHARREHAQRRDHRQVPLGVAVHDTVVGTVPGPDHVASSRELFAEVYRRLSTEERRLVDMRNAGRDWASIAREQGVNAVALRKQFSRALNRVAQQLGIDDGPD
jgi:DNA-directed RNA polymerase specialized sigma24 family protein